MEKDSDEDYYDESMDDLVEESWRKQAERSGGPDNNEENNDLTGGVNIWNNANTNDQ